MMLMNFGIDWLNSNVASSHTFLHLVEEYFFHPGLILLAHVLCKQLFGLARMLEALIVVVDVEKNLVLEVNQFVLSMHRLHILAPLLLKQPNLFPLHSIDCFCYTLYSCMSTLTN